MFCAKDFSYIRLYFFPPLNQDLNMQFSGFTVQPVLAAGAESTVKEAYSHPLLMRLCTR